jgi:hypothetical protein
MRGRVVRGVDGVGVRRDLADALAQGVEAATVDARRLAGDDEAAGLVE